MKRILLALLVALLGAMACSKKEAVIYNGCKGSWLRIRFGDQVLFQRLEYGREESIETVRFLAGRSTSFQLVAVGFSLRDNTPLGSTSQWFTIRNSSGSFTSPSLPSWNITSLTDSASGSGCEK